MPCSLYDDVYGRCEGCGGLVLEEQLRSVLRRCQNVTTGEFYPIEELLFCEDCRNAILDLEVD